MPRQRIFPNTIKDAVQVIIPYLEDTSNAAHKAIYFDGWDGLAASVVLRAIVEDPPPSLLKKFKKIIHLDCSRWRSRRELQRTIAQELKLPHRIIDLIDRQDEEDDFKGIDEASRAEIQDVAAAIHRALQEHRYLVVFQNGSDNTIDLDHIGIPLAIWGARVLWTFRGRLRLNSGISENVDNSHLYLYDKYTSEGWNYLLQNEAREIARYMDNLGEVVEECCLYILSLNCHGGNNKMDYNWATHASNYWVCDGIIQGGQDDKAWEVAAALRQHIDMEDYSSNVLPTSSFFLRKLETPPKRWILAKDSSVVQPESTSFFLAAAASGSDPPLRPLPNDMFQQSDKLRVLKLCHCTFSFSAPPFCCCHSLRFLGLDGCKDQRAEEDKKRDRPAMEFFRSLWVLDICHTDWEFALSSEITEQMVGNIREVHIKKGRIWCHSFAWRQLQGLRKLRVIEPTSPWQTGKMDEFTDMVKLEFLDLTGDSTIQVLPSMSGATSLKFLVLDGCVGLEHVGPEGLPPSLESFSLDAPRARGDHEKGAKISRISLAGCARLVNFRLCGSLPNLEDLDLSGTLVKTLDLKDQVVQAPNLQQIILLGCLQLLSILWPENGMPKDTVLRIDSSVCHVQAEPHQAYATLMDIRFVQTLVLEGNVEFCWKSTSFHLKLCVPCSNKVEEQSNKEKVAIGSSGQIMGPPRPKSSIPNAYITYMEVVANNITVDDGYNSAPQFQPLGSHVEIGDGFSFTRMESIGAMKATIFVMNKAKSLHVHDNSSITTVNPEHMMSTETNVLTWQNLKSCHVVRCQKMHTVFNIDRRYCYFEELVNFLAADLLMTHCIWSKEITHDFQDTRSFAKLQSIHLFSCPRLTFVLQWSRLYILRSLEILHITFCGDLKQVFPVEPEILARIGTSYHKGVLEFANLKHIYLHQLFKLKHICEAKMFAPKLETIRVRGCWGLRRLPAVGRDSHPVVDCEKDWWEKLEWDGLEAGHDPSLFEPRHSAHYKKPLPRGSVLW